MEEEIATLTAEHKQKTENRNDLLVRIISVTDDILRDQLREEYLACETELAELGRLIENKSIAYTNHMAKFVLEEMIQFYENQFIACELSEIFSLHNLSDEFKRLRMRPICNLSQRRELCLFLNEIKRQIVLCDYENIPFEKIGKIDDPNPIKINCRGFSKIQTTTMVCLLRKT